MGVRCYPMLSTLLAFTLCFLAGVVLRIVYLAARRNFMQHPPRH